jgi:hypothetical protein
MPDIFNKHHKNAPKGAIYVGRPTKWGNPFTHDPKVYMAYANSKTPMTLCNSREEAVTSYRNMVMSNKKFLDEIRAELRDKDLVCWCHPAACHAEVLMEIANEDVDAPTEAGKIEAGLPNPT